MNVHIATVGTTKEPIIDGVLYYPTRPGKVYLIYTRGSRRVAEEIRESLRKSLPELDVKFGLEVDEYSLEDVIESILVLIKKEQHSQVFINITGGTKVMASAALASAYFAGVNAYYIAEGEGKPAERIKDLPIPELQLKDLLKDKDRRILSELLKQEGRQDKYNMTRISDELGERPKSLSYHMNGLERRGLVRKKRGGRITIPELTHTGKLLLLLENG